MQKSKAANCYFYQKKQRNAESQLLPAALFVYRFSMSYVQQWDDFCIIVYAGDNSIVAYPVPPWASAVGGQAFTMVSGIFTLYQVFANPCGNEHRCMYIHFFSDFSVSGAYSTVYI